MTYDKHARFCDALVKENLLKFKLEELREARSKGIKTEDEFKKFLMQKKNIFAQKIKEYEILLKEPFAYKQAESQKLDILASLEEINNNSSDIETEFCQRIGISMDQFIALKDKISGNLESKLSQNLEDGILLEELFLHFILALFEITSTLAQIF